LRAIITHFPQPFHKSGVFIHLLVARVDHAHDILCAVKKTNRHSRAMHALSTEKNAPRAFFARREYFFVNLKKTTRVFSF